MFSAEVIYRTMGIILIMCFIIHNVESDATTFTIDLIHRDSPQSPLYNPQNTRAHRFRKALASSSFFPSNFNELYLAKIKIGTPPQDIFLQIDTGSNLVWTQCLPCQRCYHQVNPIYDPRKSTSYKYVPCESDNCRILATTSGSCTTDPTVCNFTYGYISPGDNTSGVLATETFRLSSKARKTVPFRNIVFGCGHNNAPQAQHSNGVLGMGGGPASFVSQVSSLVGGRKFSQCIVPVLTNPNITSKLIFGRGSEVEGDGVVSTPLVHKDDPTPYSVTVEGFSVKDVFVPFSTSSRNVTKGSMSIDNGTFPMLLPKDLLHRLIRAIKDAVPFSPSEEKPSRLCYSSQDGFYAPPLIMHFDNGANVTLRTANTFAEGQPGVFCFVAEPVDWEEGILGSFVQTNFHMGFDLDKEVVSFKPSDCTLSNK